MGFAFLFLQKKKSTKLISNGLANGLCIFVNLAKSWDGLAYMQARGRLDIPSHALLPCALFPRAAEFPFLDFGKLILPNRWR
jgi:hypothetical protein